jgi:hypothetical protein
MDNDLKELGEKINRPKSVAEMMPKIIAWLVMGVLIILKSLGMITLSWWWITIFLWLPFAILFGILGIGLVVLIFGGVCFGVVCFIEYISNRSK